MITAKRFCDESHFSEQFLLFFTIMRVSVIILCIEDEGNGWGGGVSGGDVINTNLYSHFFTNRVINNWNNLPCNIVTAGTLNTFKNLIDKHWNQYISKLESKR